jgi:hypothetical protein
MRRVFDKSTQCLFAICLEVGMSTHIDFRAVAEESLAAHPTSNLYFLLDHGGLPGLHRQLKNSSAEWVTLFDRTHEANALDVAPFLVSIGSNGQLRMFRSLFEWIGKNGTYTSTVIMLSSPLKIQSLQSRLTARLDVGISEDMKAMLRFFDPRIFEGLMNVLSPEQLNTFLAPAEKWWYVDRAGKLMSLEATFNAIEKSAAPLVLSAKQEFDLVDASEPDRVLASLRENAPELIQKLPLSAQYDFVATNFKTARSNGLISIADLVLYNIVVLVKGIDFVKGATWSTLMDDVKSKSIDFLEVVSSLGIDEERREP